MQLNYISYTPAEGIIYCLQTDALLLATRQKQKRAQPHGGATRARGLVNPQASLMGQELLLVALAFSCKAPELGTLLTSRFLCVLGLGIPITTLPVGVNKYLQELSCYLGFWFAPCCLGTVFEEVIQTLAAPRWL